MKVMIVNGAIYNTWFKERNDITLFIVVNIHEVLYNLLFTWLTVDLHT